MFSSEITIWRCRTVTFFDGPVLVAFVTVTVIVSAVTFTPVAWDLRRLVVGVPRVTRKFLATNVISQL
jgi:hypothetical protein